MKLKIWPAVASMLLVFGIANGAKSTLNCPPTVRRYELTCECGVGAGDIHGSTATIWSVDGNTPPASSTSGVRKQVYTNDFALDDGINVLCTYPGSSQSDPVKTVVEEVKSPKITCVPPPNQVDVQTTCTCKSGNKAKPTMYEFTIAGERQPESASDTQQHTVRESDQDQTITCIVKFGDIVSGEPMTHVEMEFAQKKPTLEGTKQKSDNDLPVTCRAANAEEGGLQYNWYYTKPGQTTPTRLNASPQNAAKYTLPIKKQKKNEAGNRYQCEVVNDVGPSPKSDASEVTYTGAGELRPSLMIMGFILLLTTTWLKE